jgi:hypothetical protein
MGEHYRERSGLKQQQSIPSRIWDPSGRNLPETAMNGDRSTVVIEY